MAKHRIDAAILAPAALLSCALALLPSCATKRGEPEPPKSASPQASIATRGAVPLDRYRARLPFVLELRNPGTAALVLEGFDARLFVDGAAMDFVERAEPTSLGGGDSAALPFELVADARKLGEKYSSPDGPTAAAYRVEAKLSFMDGRGGRVEAKAEAEGVFPLVREPALRILSLKIERDILVTTNLKLAIEARNPNDFPVALKNLRYVFDGEGKPWAEGSAAGPFDIPARSSRRMELAFEMNFADRDRKLFDIVANLGIVRFGLEGSATVDADLGFPLAFPLKFDEEGSCRVDR